MAPDFFQDLMSENHCWGCGPRNDRGLRLKTFWDGERSVSLWTPSPEHAAGPRHVLNGGVIATLIDCHAICTAVADAYREEKRRPGEGETIWYVTGHLEVHYVKPTPIAQPVRLEGVIEERELKKTRIRVTLSSHGETTAEGNVLGIRVPAAWLEGDHGN